MQPIKLTVTEYFNYSGINLNLEFMNGASDDGTSGAIKFLENISIDLWDYLKSNYFFDEAEFEKATQLDSNIIKQYKRALCHQVEYLLVSGDKMLNAEMVDILPNIRNLAPKAKQILRMLGLTNIQPIDKRVGFFG